MSQINTVAVIGASGFVGQYLIKALAAQGKQVIAVSRKDRSRNNTEQITWKACDLFSRKDIEETLAGCDAAYYLAHSMILSARLEQGSFADFDLVLADNFARAARQNQLKQIIYLSGIIPDSLNLSPHLLSRHEVEQSFHTCGVPTTALRAGIVIGPEGSSFALIYRLVSRLPIMICPSWTSTLSSPIGITDTVQALTYCLGSQQCYNRHYDIGGSSTLSYLDMMRELGQLLGRRRLLLVLPFFSPTLSKLWVCTITQAPKTLVYPLIQSLKTHMVPNIHHRLPEAHFQPQSYKQALESSLKDGVALARTPNAFHYTGTNEDNQVRSIQRLETLYRYSAEQVAHLYFNWLGRTFKPLLKVEVSPKQVSIRLRLINRPIMVLEHHDPDSDTEGYQVYFVRKGLLTEGKGRGRLVFRNVVGGRYTMVEVHEFVPRLPWYIYKYTQAVGHLITMHRFNRWLLRQHKNTISSAAFEPQEKESA